jgi:hypothetical protein
MPGYDERTARSADSVESIGPRLIEPVCDRDPYPRYEPGEYEVECVGASVGRDPQFGVWKAYLRFRLLSNGHPVWGFLNLGSKKEPHAGRRSEYWRAWVIAHGSQPRKRQTLTARVFKGKLVMVRIGDVTRRFDGRDHSSEAIYSTVKQILRRTYP